ncbi:MAG: aspartyl/asparaginyl beta-hydroxylase domain-containing protein [Pirellulaceae bacterium]|nr:aspartyl/asparaginyl beta-hydroxylase domain-containing protein [Planctomycetales bacterium]
MFYDSQSFSFVPRLRQTWRAVLGEFEGVQHLLEEWCETELFDRSWKVFRLFEFPHGERIDQACEACPHTAALIESCFPEHGAGGFSVLEPWTTIHPHVGYAGRFLRCHLGLKVPAGDCAIRVGDDVRNWSNGDVMIFDDRVEHAAWNRTDERRVILLVDFVWPSVDCGD